MNECWVAAILGALAQEQAGSFRLDPHGVCFIWHELRLARQSGHPETVGDVH